MIKENINKLDNELKTLFDSVAISESQEKAKFFITIQANKVFENKKISLKVIIEKPQFEHNSVKWRYFANPEDTASFLVERVSLFESLADDINDVVVRKKLDSDYLASLEEEKIEEEVAVEEDNREDLVKLLDNFGLKHLESHRVIEDNVWTNLSYFKHNLRNSDKVRVEMALEAAGWNKVIWNADKLLVKYYS